MGKVQERLLAATGVLLIGTVLTVLPSVSTAAPPPAPEYVCSTAAKPKVGAIKVMIAGDSITNSSAGDYTWPYWLWRDQAGRGAKINFVGGFNGTYDINTGRYDSRGYLDCDFDQDKEARSGVKLWTAQSTKLGLGSRTVATTDPTRPNYPGQTSWIRGTTNRFKPGILVLFAGANDLLVTDGEPIRDRSEAGIANFVIGKLKYVIAQARLGRPGIDVILTTVPRVGPKTSRYNLYNAKLPSVVKSMNTKKQRVVLAKMPSWQNHTWDGSHPDAIGEVLIAAAIDDALHKVNPALLARPARLARPAVGPRFPAVLSGQVVSGSAVDLQWTYPPGADRAIIYSRVSGGAWVKEADLVKASLRRFFPNDGTETCATRCTSYQVTGLRSSTNYEFRIQIGKGHAVASMYSNVVYLKTRGLFG